MGCIVASRFPVTRPGRREWLRLARPSGESFSLPYDGGVTPKAGRRPGDGLRLAGTRRCHPVVTASPSHVLAREPTDEPPDR